MSLKSLRINVDEAVNGDWVKFSANADGTVPRFLLKRSSKLNKAYTKAMRNLIERHSNINGELDPKLVNEEEFEAENLEIFVDTLLGGWENNQPNDDGVELPYSRENAIKFLGDPQWATVYGTLQERVKVIGNEHARKLEANAKN